MTANSIFLFPNPFYFNEEIRNVFVEYTYMSKFTKYWYLAEEYELLVLAKIMNLCYSAGKDLWYDLVWKLILQRFILE